MTASGQLRVTQGAQERETSDQSTDPRAHDTMVLPDHTLDTTITHIILQVKIMQIYNNV